MILAIFDLQVTPMLATKFGVNWPFGSGEEAKHSFKMVAMEAILDFLTEQVKLFLIYKSPQCFLPCLVNWLLGLGEEAKNIFSRWPPWQPSRISDWQDFSYF